LGLFAIAEVHPTYLIVNFTRNTKGFVSLKEREDLHKHLEVGQFIIASVAQTGTSQFNVETSGLQNKKLQLLVSHDAINKSLTSENVVPNMTLQGELSSKEAKGFLINFGLKDKAQGFLPFSTETEHLQIGTLVQVTVKQVMSQSKIIKCEIINREEVAKAMNSKELTIHNIKPGFLVHAKVQRTLDNGIEVGFLGGFSGTIFVDHLDKEPNKYKSGDKLIARIVTVDPMT
jgi:ribosomal protein S1